MKLPTSFDPVTPDEAARLLALKAARTDFTLALRKAEGMDDWYLIEWHAHDDNAWWAPNEYGAHLMTSARIGDCDVEGTGHEMRCIAEAIRTQTDETFKRVGLLWVLGGAHLYSPRNSRDSGPVLPPRVLDALAAVIDRLLPGV